MSRPTKYNPNRVRAALEKTVGNITAAAKVLGCTKTHAMRLVRQYRLNRVARKMRVSEGGNATGRPRASA